MIKTIRNKGLEQFYETGKAGKLSVKNTDRVRLILEALSAATKAEDMNRSGRAHV